MTKQQQNIIFNGIIMNNKRTLTQHAATAKAIRVELKQEFPLIKFSVKAHSFAGGDAVDVEWSNGPTYEAVMRLVGKYQYGKFEGITDCYDYTNSRNDIPQVKYVQVRREISDEIVEQVFNDLKSYYAGWENLKCAYDTSFELMQKWNFWTPKEFILRRILEDQDLTHGYQKQ